MSIKDDFILSQINKGYLVGGSVRDFLLNSKHSEDRDIAIKNAEIFSKELAEKFDATLIELDSENKIYRVVLPDKTNYLDISEIQGDTIKEDLLRRDFTINAIAYDLEKNEFIDISEGIKDLEQQKIRHIKDSNFSDDPLRVLRAFRFASVTGFDIADETKVAINKYKHLFMNPAKERINYEIMKLFGGNYTAKTLLLMDEFEILEEIFPYVKEMKKVPPNTHHHLDLFHHVVETVRNIEELFINSNEQAVWFAGFSHTVRYSELEEMNLL